MWDAPGDALYYTLSGGGVWRINYTASANRAPTAVASANPTSGSAPLAVNFSSAGSSDPDSDPITFGWNFGDGSATVSETNPAHTYTSSGVFTATLVVTDSNGLASPPVKLTINPGNTPPTAQIISPTTSFRFIVGQVITVTGVASDTQDGDVSNRIGWKVELVHVPFSVPTNTHAHPFFSGTGSSLKLPAMPPPEDADAAVLSHLRIQMTVSDTKGLTTIVTQTLEPQRVSITFATSPAGLQVDVNNTPISATTSMTMWQGQSIQLVAPGLQQASDGTFYKFSKWSNNGAATHTISAPGANTTYTATFVEVPPADVKKTYLTLLVR